MGEEMRNIVNQCFTEVIDIIQAHGGDVLKFAGMVVRSNSIFSIRLLFRLLMRSRVRSFV